MYQQYKYLDLLVHQLRPTHTLNDAILVDELLQDLLVDAHATIQVQTLIHIKYLLYVHVGVQLNRTPHALQDVSWDAPKLRLFGLHDHLVEVSRQPLCCCLVGLLEELLVQHVQVDGEFCLHCRQMNDLEVVEGKLGELTIKWRLSLVGGACLDVNFQIRDVDWHLLTAEARKLLILIHFKYIIMFHKLTMSRIMLRRTPFSSVTDIAANHIPLTSNCLRLRLTLDAAIRAFRYPD